MTISTPLSEERQHRPLIYLLPFPLASHHKRLGRGVGFGLNSSSARTKAPLPLDSLRKRPGVGERPIVAYLCTTSMLQEDRGLIRQGRNPSKSVHLLAAERGVPQFSTGAKGAAFFDRRL